MPVPSNTSPATAKVLTVGVVDTTVAADVQLAPNGTGYTSNCQPSNPQKNALWYQYTVPSGVYYISFGVKGIPFGANYNPVASIWTQTSPGIYAQFGLPNNHFCSSLTSSTTLINSFLFVVVPGTIYFFQVQNIGTTIDYSLQVLVTNEPTGVGVAGNIIIPDEFTPYPAAVIDQTSGTVIGYIGNGKNWAGEVFSLIQSSGLSLNQVTGLKSVNCFGVIPALTPITTIDLSTWHTSGGIGMSAVSDQVSKHYVQTQAGSVYYIHRIDAATGVKEVTYTLPNPINTLIGVNPTLNILYYTDGNDFSTVRRFNVSTGVALSDFLPNSGNERDDGFVLPTGNVIIVTADTTSVFDIYKSDGTHITSFTRPNYHKLTLDNNLTGIWFWEAGQLDFNHAMIASLSTNDQHFTCDSLVPVTSGGPKTNSDGSIFGFSSSCPILVYPSAGAVIPPDLGGLYFVNPTKTHDIYNTDEMKIPNPTVKSALLGE